MKKSIIAIAFLLSLQTFSQEEKLIIGSEFRSRALLDMGYKSPKGFFDAPMLYISQRTRLNAEFQKEIFTAYVSMQDVRIWGDDDLYSGSGSFGNSQSLLLHQAWVNIGCTEKSSLKIGRQMFSYDDQRLLSSRGWNDYQVTYDAFLFQRKDSLFDLDLGLSYNAINSKTVFYDPVKYKSLNFIRLAKEQKKFSISLISICSAKTKSETSEKLLFTSTHGINLIGKSKNWLYRISTYYQHNISSDEKISAYCFSLNFGKSFSNNRIKSELGFDYISGNNENNLTKNQRFDLLYGRRHAYYGYIDYFSSTPSQGLQDIFLKNSININKKLSVEATIHSFLLSEEIPGGLYDKNLGQEADLVLKYKIKDYGILESGYSYYFRSKSLNHLKNVENTKLFPPQFFYIMLSVKLQKELKK
ncbi:MAG: alginate export family protein [Bacteroidales bacterium]|nr:alginate export family protein [Bacteroidales bacterium]